MLGFIFVQNVGTQFKKTKTEFNLKNLVNMLCLLHSEDLSHI